MFLVPSERQYRNNYLFRTLHADILNNYINIIISSSYIYSVRLDNQQMVATLFFTINSSDYSYAHIPVVPGTHRVSADIEFGLIIYGFDEYISYCHVGG